MMEEEIAKEKESIEIQNRVSELKRLDEERTAKKREKRNKRRKGNKGEDKREEDVILKEDLNEVSKKADKEMIDIPVKEVMDNRLNSTL